jgi:hypothetical protein
MLEAIRHMTATHPLTAKICLWVASYPLTATCLVFVIVSVAGLFCLLTHKTNLTLWLPFGLSTAMRPFVFMKRLKNIFSSLIVVKTR